MSKVKGSVFLSTMVVAILIVGNWVVPVQANSVETTTPTPLATVTTEPVDLGKVVPTEQQEALKNIIENYFEMRYYALSTSQQDDFPLKNFGNLVSNGADAKAFLDAEPAKIAIEIKYAKLNRVRYVDYKYFLKFDNFAFDTSNQLATVSVVEDNEVIYEISVEHDPKKPFVSKISGIQHKITLRQEQDQWKIVSDDYSDLLWRVLRETGTSPETMLSAIKVLPIETLRSENNQIGIASLLPDDDSIHAFDRVGAVNYALAHSAAATYNPDYPNYDDGQHGDCTNFVSQAIYEGGNASMSIPSPLPNPDIGGFGWYLFSDIQRAAAWNDVQQFYDFVTGYAFSNEGPEGREVTSVSELMLGDVIQYRVDTDNVWDHAVIVVGFDGAGTPIVASHSPNTIPPGILYTGIPNIQTRFIHIERSDGVPPARAKIVLGSDDAGTNPTGCGFSSTDNEVYFGACFGSGNITSGFRFSNMQLPKKAQMKYAYINFTVDGTYTDPLSLNIYGEDAANSATFTGSSTPANRSTPYSPIPWSIAEQWDLGLRRTSPDLSPVIQNIINRSDWANGNSLSVIIKNAGSNTRRVIAFERASWDPSLSPAKVISTYTVTTIQATSNSVASKDGWLLESSETSGVGGSNNSNANTFNVGDDASNKQYRSILHFDTSGVPDNAVIISAILKIKQQSINGTNPFTTHGNLVADIKKPNFGTNANLANSDFQDAPGLSGSAMFDSTPLNSWYSAILNSTAFPHINLTGTTQFRLAFTLDDNNDLGADNIAFSSGSDGANAPQLIINYYIPAP